MATTAMLRRSVTLRRTSSRSTRRLRWPLRLTRCTHPRARLSPYLIACTPCADRFTCNILSRTDL